MGWLVVNAGAHPFLKGRVKEKAVGVVAFSDTCHSCPFGRTCHRKSFMRTLTVGTLEGEVRAPANIGARGLSWTFTVGKGMILPAARAYELGGIVLVGARRLNMRVEGLAVVTLNGGGDVFGCWFEGPRDG